MNDARRKDRVGWPMVAMASSAEDGGSLKWAGLALSQRWRNGAFRGELPRLFKACAALFPGGPSPWYYALAGEFRPLPDTETHHAERPSTHVQ